MEAMLPTYLVLIVSAVLLITWLWKLFNWISLSPNKIEKCLRQQGLHGPSYKLFNGNAKEKDLLTSEARSKPMELSHRIVPRVMPFVHHTIQKYGKVCFTWIGPVPKVIVMDTNMIRDILFNKSGDFLKESPNPLAATVVAGVATYDGEKWAKHRRILNPAFYQEKLKMMIPAIDTSCSEMLNQWLNLVPDEDSAEVDVWPYLKIFAADVISRTAFGSSYEEGRRIFHLLTELLQLFVEEIFQSIYIPGFRFLPTKRANKIKKTSNRLKTLLRDLIIRRQNTMKTGETHSSDDLLGILLESNSKEISDNKKSSNVGMSMDEVIEECKLFYIAGQETTANLIVWTMISLSMHQDWQMKAREEVLQVFGKRKPDFEGLNHLKIVSMILTEVLRLYPPVISLDRAIQKEIKLGEITLPANIQLEIPTLLVHHDSELWGKDAEDFNPNRFSEGTLKATKNQVSYFPFGWGPRFCIGQTFALIEAKMALAMILQQFSFHLSTTYIHAPIPIPTLQPQYGAQLMLRKL